MSKNEQEKLQRLLKKYLAGELSPEEEAIVAEWYENLNHQATGPEPDENLQSRKSKNWEILNAKIQQAAAEEEPDAAEEPGRTISWSPNYWYGIAATFLLLLGFALYPRFRVPENQVALLQKQNDLKKAQRVALSDGSLVWLEPGSQIKYPVQFTGASRDVFLHGKAFFSVARDKQHPFRVYGSAVEVKVLGTSFGVDFTTEQVAEVLVRTGKVAVTSTEKSLPDYLPFVHTAKKTVQLQLNEKAHFDATRDTAIKQKISKLYWEKQLPLEKLVFPDNPLTEVIQALEDQHRVTITLANVRLKQCNLTAYFYNQPLPVKLDMICKSIGATYQVDDDKYLISGAGCL
ncbi:FecR family protein [Adhaeribacter swui]|uniref:FecR family protein n=1 Tax=Adhaeribacter swui TaxID=2086471 RepID=A0A7G7G4N7_9BACT|nr:FecR family protein [Adhaeribacter swui]QNF32121.1 FecR family protein [Adhaeribacter swui]